jgi:GTP pyrophosphokinase
MYGKLQQLLKNSPDPALVQKAFEFAKAAHGDQKRSSGEEYIFHPLKVAQTLSDLKLGPKTIVAGLLHDVVDDTTKTLKDIEKEFGKEVAFLVEGVSKLGKLRYPKSFEMKSAKSRLESPIDLKAENLRKMFFAMGQDIRVVLIKLADRLHNMETLGALPPEKRNRIALETLEIFAPLANRLGIGDIKGRLEDLSFPYLYPKEYEWLVKNTKERYEQRERQIKKIKPLLAKILKEGHIEFLDIHSRSKHSWSLYQKLLRHDMDFDRIYDLVALRIIVKDVKTCYEALGVVHKSWRPLPGRIKDYIAFPKPSGYQALHTTVFAPEGQIVEIQVKTEAMHQEAEFGIAAHWAAKEGINLKTQRKKFSWVQQLKDWQSKITGPEEFLEGLKVDFFKNRIFILTPKGDIIDLPEGATAIDFAYAIHTDVGNHCIGVKINGKMARVSQPLKNTDVVEIILDKNKKPSLDWLKFAKTNLAKSRIKSALNQKSVPQVFKAIFNKNNLPDLSKALPWTKPKKEPTISLAGQTGMQVYLAKCCSPKPEDKIVAYITRTKGASVHKIDCPNFNRVQKKWPQKIIEASWKR